MKGRPSDLVIVSRKIDFDPLPTLKENRVWHQDGVVMTHFLNAFQSLFPKGERVFIEAARDRVAVNPSLIEKDAILQDDLSHFIEQEGRHSVYHDKWTKALIDTDYPGMADYEMELHNFRTWAKTHLDKMTRLSITCGAEQYTASLARLFSKDRPEIVFKSAPIFQKIFLYHAMEELEHKSVSYDLYKKRRGGYIRRMAGMGFITYYIWWNVLRRHRYLMRKDGQWDRQKRREYMQFYFGERGLFRVVLPKIFEYMRPSFHPWQNDERAEFEETFKELRERFGIQGFQYNGKQLDEEKETAAEKKLEEVIVKY